MKALSRAPLAWGWCAMAAVLLVAAWSSSPIRADVATLKNGMTVDGTWSPIFSLLADPTKAGGGSAVPSKRIVVLDNDLTRTFFGTNQLAKEFTPSPAIREETIKVPQKVATTGLRIGSVGSPLRVDPFDDWGRRTMVMRTERGTMDIVQGITEITPKWTKLEAIQGTHNYIWDMRIATSAIPREQLSRILYKLIDKKNSDQRLRVVRLYLQAERFQDARAELVELLKDFPDLAHLKDQVKALHQQGALRLLKEVELRNSAGQAQLATAMLEQFPADGVAGETLLRVREMMEEIKGQKTQAAKTIALLQGHLAELKEESARESVAPIIAEIARDLGASTLDRMADYLRLADDPKIPAEGKVSLAISGWLLGSGSAAENLPVSQSLVKIRTLVQTYLVTAQKPDRDDLLTQLTSLEGATAENLAKIIAQMRPPFEAETIGEEAAGLDPADAIPAEEAPAEKVDADKPDASERKPEGDQPADDSGISGLYERTVKGLPEQPEIKYWVQLPPEYDSYRRYPCLVTLDGAGTTPLQQISWWAGDYSPDAKTRYGQATRHGYIVIAPEWTREHQRKYEYSAREHAAVLLALRDACKRFAIDTDRVFLSGHSMGGDAAWDIGLAHPDLWGGVIPIVATGEKYVTLYHKNGRYVPMYFISGEKDSNKRSLNAPSWDRYLLTHGYDAIVVEFLGRGHEHFHDEIQNLFTWMNLHKRDFFPKEFVVTSLRPWDNFFWWVETAEPRETTMILPAQWGTEVPRPAETDAKINAANGINVKSPCEKVTVWLAPEMITFDTTLRVTINGRAQRNIQPSASTLLEDVRTRGDRQHAFWAKVENK